MRVERFTITLLLLPPRMRRLVARVGGRLRLRRLFGRRPKLSSQVVAHLLRLVLQLLALVLVLLRVLAQALLVPRHFRRAKNNDLLARSATRLVQTDAERRCRWSKINIQATRFEHKIPSLPSTLTRPR